MIYEIIRYSNKEYRVLKYDGISLEQAYSVFVDRDTVKCNCIGFKIHSSFCKHIKWVKKLIARIPLNDKNIKVIDGEKDLEEAKKAITELTRIKKENRKIKSSKRRQDEKTEKKRYK